MKRLLICFVKFYRKYISPLKKPCCKYYPTCSTYALEALERFGAVKGTLLAVYRVLRCNPFSRGGYDPVPEKKARGNGFSDTLSGFKRIPRRIPKK